MIFDPLGGEADPPAGSRVRPGGNSWQQSGTTRGHLDTRRQPRRRFRPPGWGTAACACRGLVHTRLSGQKRELGRADGSSRGCCPGRRLPSCRTPRVSPSRPRWTRSSPCWWAPSRSSCARRPLLGPELLQQYKSPGGKQYRARGLQFGRRQNASRASCSSLLKPASAHVSGEELLHLVEMEGGFGRSDRLEVLDVRLPLVDQ